MFLEQACTTPTNKRGKCLPILDCTPLLNDIRNSINNSQIRKYIREHQCEFTSKPMFCCPIDFQQRIKKITTKLPKARDGVCGRSYSEHFPTRIVGGDKAFLGEFPWSAMLVYLKRKRENLVLLF